jgi:hypothetical protein
LRHRRKLQRLRFTVAGAAQAQRRANPAEIAATEHDPVDVVCLHFPCEGSSTSRAFQIFRSMGF